MTQTNPIQLVTRQNVLEAIQRIQREGFPETHSSTKYSVVHAGRTYPPKYLLSLAVECATGRAFSTSEFYGGAQTNEPLRRLGFEIAGPGKSQARESSVLPQTQKRASVPRPSKPDASRSDAPVIVRAVVNGCPPASLKNAERLLLDAVKKLPANLGAKFLLTPGGFAQQPFPRNFRGQLGWNSTEKDLAKVLGVATEHAKEVVSSRVLSTARGRVQFITLGLDLGEDGRLDDHHAELVAVFDVSTGRLLRWTGKSYPISDQEDTLLHVADVRSHLLEIGGERVLVLGCHDLNMWSPRSHSRQKPGGERRQRCDLMRKLARQFRPTVVLQHPHQTDSANIWALGWSGIMKDLPDVTSAASGIAYYGRNGEPRRPLESVLARTQRGEKKTRDIYIDGDR
ncbi:MAG: hypothetical protein SFV15_14575 [Polyangiaceae bacterium]|nr:hypothetical protein [Polyangiaceae bacterium]